MISGPSFDSVCLVGLSTFRTSFVQRMKSDAIVPFVNDVILFYTHH